MPIILACLIHRGTLCYDGCVTYDAIDFGARPMVIDESNEEPIPAFRTSIETALLDHLEAYHSSYRYPLPLLITCYFVWRDNGRGRDLLSMDEDAVGAQFGLAQARGCVDYIHVEFTTVEEDPMI